MIEVNEMAAMLTQEQIDEYRRKGYVLLRGFFSADEAAAWDVESRRLLTLGLGHRDNWRSVTYRTNMGLTILDRLGPVIDISPAFKRLVQEKRILQPLRELYGEEMLLFKDKIIYKMLGVPGYKIHQDYSSWQVFPKDLVNVIVSIDAADEENGGVEFFLGYHDRLLSTPGEIRHMNRTEAEQIDFSRGEMVRTRPGDMVIFDCLTPHRSGINKSERLRRQLYLTYSSARNGDLYQRQLEHVEQVRRKEAGEAAARLFFR